MALFRDCLGELVQEEIFWTFMVQGKITEADTPTIQLGTTPSGLISCPPPQPSPIFMPDALPATTLPLYPGLGQAPNMLACIPSGMVLGIGGTGRLWAAYPSCHPTNNEGSRKQWFVLIFVRPSQDPDGSRRCSVSAVFPTPLPVV